MDRPRAYLAALAVTTVAVLIRLALDPVIGNSFPFVTLFGAVAAAVWLGGVGPAMAATLAGYLATAGSLS